MDHIGHRDWRCDPTGASYTYVKWEIRCMLGKVGARLNAAADGDDGDDAADNDGD